MHRKRKWLISAVMISAAIGIIGGAYLYYGRITWLRSCAVDINGTTYSSSQPLAEELGVWEHDIENISLSGNLEMAVFSATDGFSLVTAEQGSMDVAGLTQLFLIDGQESTVGEITFTCSDGSSYSASLKGNESFLGVKMLGGEL